MHAIELTVLDVRSQGEYGGIRGGSVAGERDSGSDFVGPSSPTNDLPTNYPGITTER
jgi:hypothetical protein